MIRKKHKHWMVIGLLFAFLAEIVATVIIIKHKYIHYRMSTKAIKLKKISISKWKKYLENLSRRRNIEA